MDREARVDRHGTKYAWVSHESKAVQMHAHTIKDAGWLHVPRLPRIIN